MTSRASWDMLKLVPKFRADLCLIRIETYAGIVGYGELDFLPARARVDVACKA